MTDTAPAPTAAKKEGKRPRRKTQPQDAKGGKAPPRARKVNPVLERLFELYPKMFGARFLPQPELPPSEKAGAAR